MSRGRDGGMTEMNYWTRWAHNRASRRRFLVASGAVGAGIAAAATVGCGGDDDDNGGTQATGTSQAAAQPKRGYVYKISGIGYPTTFNPQLSGASTIRSDVNSRLFR